MPNSLGSHTAQTSIPRAGGGGRAGIRLSAREGDTALRPPTPPHSLLLLCQQRMGWTVLPSQRGTIFSGGSFAGIGAVQTPAPISVMTRASLQKRVKSHAFLKTQESLSGKDRVPGRWPETCLSSPAAPGPQCGPPPLPPAPLLTKAVKGWIKVRVSPGREGTFQAYLERNLRYGDKPPSSSPTLCPWASLLHSGVP